MLGAALKRREDPRLIMGRGTYTDDLSLPDLRYAAFVRSPYAHARISAINLDRARQHPGVVAVFTGRDLAGGVKPIPLIRKPPGGAEPPPIPPLAVERVLHQGEPVAVIVADSRAAVYDALALVEVDYEPLPAIVDMDRALEDGAPRLHEQFARNIAFRSRMEGGDPDRAFREAEVVVRQRMVNQRLVPMAMETRSCVAQYDNLTGKLTVWITTQRPHHTRWFISYLFDIPEHRIRVVAPDIGGAFGSKEPIYPDEVVALFCALELGVPVKWAEDRRENFLATTHGRDQVARLEAAATRDGRITAIRGACYANMGAYLYPNSPGVPIARTAPLLPGAYAIPNVSLEVYGIFTNTTPVGPYRGAGRPEATYYIERLVDLVTSELGLDPAEVRRRNFVSPDQMPYHTATDLTYDSGDYPGALVHALEMVGYDALRGEQQQAWRQGRHLGIGLSSYVELGGVTPSSRSKAEGSPGLWESATVRFLPSGKLTLTIGTSGHGQGHETTFAQLVSELLGVPYDDVDVLFGDTDVAPFGFGTFGSRSTSVGGGAIVAACRKIVDKGRKIAAHLLEAPEGDVEFAQGRFSVRGAPNRAITIQEVARTAMIGWTLPPQLEPGLDAQGYYDPPNYTFSSGTHVCLVEVDPETGGVTLLRYVAVDDCGRVVNPLLVHGQVHGGVAQGIAQALYEYVVYDESGQLVTASLLDYAVPTARQLPAYDTDLVESPSPFNPLGVKGVGEGGAIAATPAVVNAVVDALRPLGITHLDMPLTAERVWRAMQQARERPGR